MPKFDCGTAGCFAGWRVLKDGYQVDFVGYNNTFVKIENPDTGKTLQIHQIAVYAAKLFELDDDEQFALFHADNTIEDLKEMVDALCESPDRSDEAKEKLRETMNDVLDADALDLWEQGQWLIPAELVGQV